MVDVYSNFDQEEKAIEKQVYDLNSRCTERGQGVSVNLTAYFMKQKACDSSSQAFAFKMLKEEDQDTKNHSMCPGMCPQKETGAV